MLLKIMCMLMEIVCILMEMATTMEITCVFTGNGVHVNENHVYEN